MKPWISRLDEKIDSAIAALLPTPLSRAYLSYNKWCIKNSMALTIVLLVASILEIATVVISSHFSPAQK